MIRMFHDKSALRTWGARGALRHLAWDVEQRGVVRRVVQPCEVLDVNGVVVT